MQEELVLFGLLVPAGEGSNFVQIESTIDAALKTYGKHKAKDRRKIVSLFTMMASAFSPAMAEKLTGNN